MGILTSIDKFVRTQYAKMESGVNSGLNKSNTREILGIDQLTGAQTYAKKRMRGAKNVWNATKGRPAKDGQKAVDTRWGKRGKYAGALGLSAAKGAGKYFSGHGLEGVDRLYGIGARGAMATTAVATADFINPFGFGWND